MARFWRWSAQPPKAIRVCSGRRQGGAPCGEQFCNRNNAFIQIFRLKQLFKKITLQLKAFEKQSVNEVQAL